MISTITQPRIVEQVMVASRPGKFFAWPANARLWAWGDEMLVGFQAGEHKFNSATAHAMDYDKPRYIWLARSTDGGHSWTIEPTKQLSDTWYDTGTPEPVDLPDDIKIEFGHPDFVLLNFVRDYTHGPTWTQYSYDRGRSWSPRYKFPLFGQTQVIGRSDYIVRGLYEAQFFLVTHRSDCPDEGRVFTAIWAEGGHRAEFISYIGDAPVKGYAIMPSTVVLRDGALVSVQRVYDISDKENPISTLVIYGSTDQGKTWSKISTAVRILGPSAPGHLISLGGDRLAVTYADRLQKVIAARTSHDRGSSWSDEIILRSGGGNFDLGYVATNIRPDGKLVTVYYWNDDPLKERYIAGTIWQP